MNYKNIIIGILSVLLIVSVYFNFSTTNKPSELITLDEAIRDALVYGSVENSQRVAFIESRIKKDSPIFSISKSMASDCDQWMGYIQHYYNAVNNIMNKYVTSDDWSKITSAQLNSSNNLTEPGKGGGGDWENVNIADPMSFDTGTLNDIASRMSEQDKGLLVAYLQAAGEMGQRAEASCGGDYE